MVLLQNRDADGMALLPEFFGRRFDLAAAAQEFKTRHDDWEIVMHTLNCEVVVNDLESACTLTRLFLSDHPGWGRTVTLRGVEEYVRSHFTDPRGYRFSCDHDVLLLRRRWVGNRVHRIFIWRMGPWQVRRSFTCTSTSFPRFEHDGFGLRFGPDHRKRPGRAELDRIAALLRDSSAK